MTADQPLNCPRCQGVTVAVDATAYTPARGRLIVTHGYCRGDCTDPAEPTPGHEAPTKAATTSDQSTPATVS
ncbi:hypothetical protein [Nonomuraea sp. NPDC050691]|uniref:hypothetical protein n=1 Tax=Nonomuraea sp. NPDC050691 TaxID=3155661 RepID=UPI0033EAE755